MGGGDAEQRSEIYGAGQCNRLCYARFTVGVREDICMRGALELGEVKEVEVKGRISI